MRSGGAQPLPTATSGLTGCLRQTEARAPISSSVGEQSGRKTPPRKWVGAFFKSSSRQTDRRFWWRNWSIGLLILVSQAGCAALPKARFPAARDALAQLSAQTGCSRALQGDASLVASGGLVKVRGKMLYLVQAPERVRFDLYSEFGVTLSTLTSDGERFSLYSLDQRSFWYGPAKTCNIKRFTQVAIPAFALVELLRGRPPVLSHAEGSATIRYARPLFSKGRYVIEIEGDHQARERLEIGVAPEDIEKPLEHQRLRLLSVRVTQAGRLLYEAKLSDHAPAQRREDKVTPEEAEMGIVPLPPSGPTCAAEVPRTVEFSVPDRGYTLVISSKDVAHNPSLAPGVFEQEIPPGVVSERSDCVD